MTSASIPSSRDDDRKQIEEQLSRLQLVDGARRFALPLAAIGAAAGIFAAPAFPIAAGTAAAIVGFGELFARSERRKLDERIRNFEQKYGANAGATFSSSANTFTVGGGS